MLRDAFIVDLWERMETEVVGAAELRLIQDAVAERFGTVAIVSPASIARLLADSGARLGHPEILQADMQWRESRLTFTAEDLALTDIASATALMERINSESSKESVRQLKAELEALAKSVRADQKRRELANEVAQWLTIWLQNPTIFAEWLDLRRSTPDFRARFSS